MVTHVSIIMPDHFILICHLNHIDTLIMYVIIEYFGVLLVSQYNNYTGIM